MEPILPIIVIFTFFVGIAKMTETPPQKTTKHIEYQYERAENGQWIEKIEIKKHIE